MIKLTEIVTEPGHYDPELGRNSSSYSLRSTYVNPNFIISVTNNEKFNNIHRGAPVVAGLIPEAKFTKIIIAAGMNGTTSYDVLGTPEQHMEQLGGRSE